MQGDNSNTPEPEANWQFKPGDTIVPRQQAAAPVPEAAPPPAATAPSDVPQEAPANSAPEAPQSAPSSSSQPSSTIHWTASEFIAHHKSAGWYVLLILAAVVIAALVWLLTKDKISAGVIIVAGIALAGYGARKPRQLEYELDAEGLRIGEKYYAYDAFRSFAVLDEGAFSSIAFMPLKRFAPLTTIYYEPADEERIVNLLADRLPMEERQHDVIDRFMRRIRY